ncbi:MAG: VOC family protein [Longimicrobiaceae bacterium]
MIKGMHVTVYTRHADELKEFLRDKLELPFTDVGHGWLIFEVPASEIAAHPVDWDGEGEEGEEGGEGGGGEGDDREPPAPGEAQLSFYCDDVEAEMRRLQDKGVEFTTGVTDQGWGLLATIRVTPDVQVDLYQPRYERDPSNG